jgi:hypothetical protein
VADYVLGDGEVVVVNPPIPKIVVEKPLSQTVLVPMRGQAGPAGTIENIQQVIDTLTSLLVSNVEPLEDPDGSRTVFTVPEAHYGDTLSVYLNGLQELHIMNKNGSTFEFDTPPSPGDEIRLSYISNV